MTSIEPKMKCDPEILFDMHVKIKPDYVSIGADSGKNNLIEPTANEISRLIELLETITVVYTKENLKRLL